MVTSLLHISASPRREASESLAIADSFLDSYRQAHPGAVIDHLDLWDGSLPQFGRDAVGAKMAVFAGQEPSGAQASAWADARRTFERFAAADGYLFSVPMWNAGIPYVLKQFIDVVSQPGMVFGFDSERGYTGLLTGRKAYVIYTSAVYGPGRPATFGSDFQAPYLDDWLRWAGVDEISTIAFRPNLAVPDAEPGRRAAHAAARALGIQAANAGLDSNAG